MQRVSAFLLLLLCVVPLFAQTTTASSEFNASEPTHYTVYLHGDYRLDKEEIYEAIGAKLPNPLFFWKKKIATLDARLLPTLEESLIALYESEGYYEAAFDYRTAKARLDITIDAGRAVKVKEINLSSDMPIERLIPFKRGERFSAKRFKEMKAKIVKQLLEKGFCSYDLDTKAYVDLDHYSVALRIMLGKGKPCRFGETHFSGVKDIDEKVLRSRVRTKKGMRYDPKKIEETYNDLYALGAFDTLKINYSRKIYNVVPIDIEVHETETPYHIELGAGYDTYVGFRVHASILHRNFMGNAQRTLLQLAWSQKEKKATVNFFKPALISKLPIDWDYGLSLGYSDLEFPGFRERKSFLNNYLEHKSGKTRLRFGLSAENIIIDAMDNFRQGQVQEQAVRTGTFLLFYPYLDFVYDARDDKLNPTEGYYLAASLEYGLPYKPDASTYLKSYIEGRYIFSLEHTTFASTLKLGTVDIYSHALPESKLFFAGGSFSNRAYGFRSIGVILSPEVDSIEGAQSWGNLSFEIEHPITRKLYGALFTDMTMLNAKAYDFSGKVISAAGVGLRYMTPVGPFKLDVGFNIHKPSQYGITFQIGQSF